MLVPKRLVQPREKRGRRRTANAAAIKRQDYLAHHEFLPPVKDESTSVYANRASPGSIDERAHQPRQIFQSSSVRLDGVGRQPEHLLDLEPLLRYGQYRHAPAPATTAVFSLSTRIVAGTPPRRRSAALCTDSHASRCLRSLHTDTQTRENDSMSTNASRSGRTLARERHPLPQRSRPASSRASALRPIASMPPPFG